MEFDDQETVDLQSEPKASAQFDDIPIASTKKAYRELILANNVSVFDFRCYIFARQISLLLRLGNGMVDTRRAARQAQGTARIRPAWGGPSSTTAETEDEERICQCWQKSAGGPWSSSQPFQGS